MGFGHGVYKNYDPRAQVAYSCSYAVVAMERLARAQAARVLRRPSSPSWTRWMHSHSAKPQHLIPV